MYFFINVLNRKMPSLQQRAYMAIPRKTYHKVKKNPEMVKENAVIDYTRTQIMKFRNLKDWAKTVKLPRQYIQKCLVILNYHTKRDFFIAYNIIRKRNRDYLVKNVGDYWDEIIENLQDKVLYDQTRSEHQTIELWDKLKWPNILQKTFYFLCYRRLQEISYVRKDDVYYDDTHDNYMNGELFNAIMKIPDTDLLPLVIYNMIYQFNKKFGNTKSPPRSPTISLTSARRSSSSGTSGRTNSSRSSGRSSRTNSSGSSRILNFNY